MEVFLYVLMILPTGILFPNGLITVYIVIKSVRAGLDFDLQDYWTWVQSRIPTL